APLLLQPVSLTDMARGIMADLRGRDPSRQVEVEIAGGLSTIGDAGLLKAALENLLGNAWKFTRRATLARITVTQQDAEHGKVFCVRDNGAGFEMAQAARLFAPFQRLHSATDFEGTGVGLATVHRIIARHGGKIWAEGKVDAGASFYFTLGNGQPHA